MQKKQLILPLLLVMLISGLPMVSAQATGDVDALCSSISDDLATAGGCIDDDDFEDTITSTGGLFTLETGDKAGLIMLFVAIGFLGTVIVSVVVGFRKVAK